MGYDPMNQAASTEKKFHRISMLHKSFENTINQRSPKLLHKTYPVALTECG
jgi:hypothetical protein